MTLYIQAEQVRDFGYTESIHFYVMAYFITLDHWLENVKKPILIY